MAASGIIEGAGLAARIVSSDQFHSTVVVGGRRT
jgi:hypothetical protein